MHGSGVFVVQMQDESRTFLFGGKSGSPSALVNLRMPRAKQGQYPMSRRSTDGRCDITKTIWGSLSQNGRDSYSAGSLSGNGCHCCYSICCFTRRGRSCCVVADRTDTRCAYLPFWEWFLGHQAGLTRSGKIAARRGRNLPLYLKARNSAAKKETMFRYQRT
jgi:hypothetical protein